MRWLILGTALVFAACDDDSPSALQTPTLCIPRGDLVVQLPAGSPEDTRIELLPSSPNGHRVVAMHYHQSMPEAPRLSLHLWADATAGASGTLIAELVPTAADTPLLPIGQWLDASCHPTDVVGTRLDQRRPSSVRRSVRSFAVMRIYARAGDFTRYQSLVHPRS